MPESKDDRYSQVEREVIDILDEFEKKPRPRRRNPGKILDFQKPRKSFLDRVKARLPTRRPALSSNLVTPLRLLILSIVAAIGAVFIDRYSETLSLVLILVAVCSFFALLFVRGTGGPGGSGKLNTPETKRWRGKDITLKPNRRRQKPSGWRRFLPGNHRS